MLTLQKCMAAAQSCLTAAAAPLKTPNNILITACGAGVEGKPIALASGGK